MTKLLRDVRQWLSRRKTQRSVTVPQDVDPTWGEPSPFLGVVPPSQEGVVADGEESFAATFRKWEARERSFRQIDNPVPTTGLDWAKAAALGELPDNPYMIGRDVVSGEAEKLTCPETGEPREAERVLLGSPGKDLPHVRRPVVKRRPAVGGEHGQLEPGPPAPDEEELQGAPDLPDAPDRELTVYKVRFQIEHAYSSDLFYWDSVTVPFDNVSDLAAAVRDCLRRLGREAAEPSLGQIREGLRVRNHWRDCMAGVKPSNKQAVLPLGGGAGPAEVVVDALPTGDAKVGVPSTVTPSPVLPTVMALLDQAHVNSGRSQAVDYTPAQFQPGWPFPR